MKILVSAYTCETGRGSEGEIGWRLVLALAQSHDVRVITRANLRPVHEASFADQPKPARLRFEYFDLPWIFRFYKKGKRLFLVYYYLWQLGAGLRARRLLQSEPADVIHHLIGGMDWMPSGLAICPGPFVWGPVGSEDTHPIILRHLPLKSQIKDKARWWLRWLMRTFEPFTRLTAARADVILSHTPDTLPSRLRPKLRHFDQTGITDDLNLARPKFDLSRGNRLKLIYAGELKDWKGARIALDAALAFFETGAEADLVIVGDGPLYTEMLAATSAHPHGGQVTFLGRVPMERVIETLHEGDVFLYPSFHHGLSTIVLQAMLTRLPILCIEGDATGRAVGNSAGITVPLSAHEAPAMGLARAIATLAEDESLRQRLAHTAREIALEHYAYDALARRIDGIYQGLAASPTLDIAVTKD
ncbi:glycosyltransferase family 4 protein [Gemmobacter sp.]|uniref:glycosyltransferase family 4 protein n=1 Tax=Gemmobacter sp. TaxID=1898957 RepID=UPI002AFFD2F3|nr:glycosyltransferase family 4 protein [Gemmobacter sp.]